ncbi:MAG: response regulator [Candidatus Odinarchaeota archaeon]
MLGKVITVLHVDDEEDYLDIVKLYLESLNGNFHVDTVSSAEKALDLLQLRDYDVIISDHQMPVITGLELLEKLRKQGNDVPFVVLAGKNGEDTIKHFKKLGAGLLLRKNSDPNTLFDELYEFISREFDLKQEQNTRRESKPGSDQPTTIK